MRTPPGLRYDPKTLVRAADDAPLQIRDGLAVSAQWVARAAEAARADLPARTPWPGGPYSPLGPGRRGRMRALLDAAQRCVQRRPELFAAPWVIAREESTARWVCLRHPACGAGLRLAQPHGALVEDGDQLVAARRHPDVYVLVLRRGAVRAAIRAVVDAEGERSTLYGLLPQLQCYTSQRPRR